MHQASLIPMGQMLSMQGQISLILMLILIGHRMVSQSSTMHQASLIPSGAYLLSQMKNQWTQWSMVIATMNVQPLERAVPHWKSAVIVDQRA